MTKKTLFKNLIVALLLALFVVPATALAQSGGLTQNTQDTAKAAGFNLSLGTGTGIATVVGLVIRIFVSLLGVIFTAYTVYGGFLWLTAAGAEEKITKAKKTIRDGIIGLIIVLAAGGIYVFISGSLLGASMGAGTPGAPT